MKRAYIVLVIIFSTLSGVAQNAVNPVFEKHLFIRNNDTMPYRLLLPQDYDPAKKYPLVLFLHGAGERGNNNESQLTHGAALFLRDSNRAKYPAIVVFPQCSTNSYWSNVNIVKDAAGVRRFNFSTAGAPTVAMSLLLDLLRQVQKDHRIEKKKRYIAGLSMGGMGTFELVRRKRKMFAAAMPICGGANPETAPALIKTDWWIFHGAKDDVVDPEYSRRMADAITKEKGKVRLTIYPAANHNSWDSAFAEPDFLQWMFSKHK